MSTSKENPYEKPHSKPIYKGNISRLDVKLFGLKIKEGQIVIPLKEEGIEVKAELLKLQELTNKNVQNKETKRKKIEDNNKKECTFKPVRSEEADKAMKNPRCGYDFVTKLGERGDFLERAFKKNEKSKADKAKLDKEKEDYEARHDTLQCPQCKKHQSFDEYIKRSRYCNQCKERFVQLNLSDRVKFDKKQKERLERKLNDEEELRKQLYEFPFKPVVNSEYEFKDKEKAANILDKTKSSTKKAEDKAYIERKMREENEKKLKAQYEDRARVRIEALTKRIYESSRPPADSLEGLLQLTLQPPSPKPPRPPQAKSATQVSRRPKSASAASTTSSMSQLKASGKSAQYSEDDMVADLFKKLVYV